MATGQPCSGESTAGAWLGEATRATVAEHTVKTPQGDC